MPLLLRQIRKSRWYKYPDVQWLPLEALQADALVDLKTEDNRLSVWQIEDDESNLDQVIAAVATKRDECSNLDYAVLDAHLLLRINAEIEVTKGDTFYDKANNLWHRNIIELSAENIMELAHMIMQHGTKKRIRHTTVASLIKHAVASGDVDRDRLKAKVQKRIS